MSEVDPAGAELLTIPTVEGRAPGPLLLVRSPAEGMLLFGCPGAGTIARWEVASGKCSWRVADDSYSYELATVLTGGGSMLLASAGDEGFYRWDALTGELLPGNPCSEITFWSVAAAVLPDGRSLLVGAGQDHLVYRWDAVTGEPLGAPLAGHNNCVKAVTTATLPDGEIMIVSGGEDTAVRRWDAVTGAVLGGPLKGHAWQVRYLRAVTLPDGRIVVVSADDDGVIRRWDAITGELIGRPILTGVPNPEIVTAAVGGRPRLFVSGEDDVVRQLNLCDGTLMDDSIPGVHVTASEWIDGTVMVATSGCNGHIMVRVLR